MNRGRAGEHQCQETPDQFELGAERSTSRLTLHSGLRTHSPADGNTALLPASQYLLFISVIKIIYIVQQRWNPPTLHTDCPQSNTPTYPVLTDKAARLSDVTEGTQPARGAERLLQLPGKLQRQSQMETDNKNSQCCQGSYA